MRTDLHPMSLGDIFDKAFDLYKRNFALFAGVTAVVQIPAQVAFSAAVLSLDMDQFDKPTRTAGDVGAIFAALGVLCLMVVAYHFFYVAHAGALSIATSERLLGRPISIGESYRRLRPSLFKLLMTWLMIDVLILVCTFILFIAFAVVASFIVGLMSVAAGGGGQAGAAVTTFAAIVIVVLPFLAFIAMALCFAVFTTQVVVIEGSGYTAALNRNWSLLRGRFWPPFWFAVILFVLVFALQLALLQSVMFILGLTLYSWLPVSHLTEQIVEQGIGTVITLFIQPFVFIGLTVLYFDQRMRREGFDIDLELYERQAPPIQEPAA